MEMNHSCSWNFRITCRLRYLDLKCFQHQILLNHRIRCFQYYRCLNFKFLLFILLVDCFHSLAFLKCFSYDCLHLLSRLFLNLLLWLCKCVVLPLVHLRHKSDLIELQSLNGLFMDLSRPCLVFWDFNLEILSILVIFILDLKVLNCCHLSFNWLYL